MSERGHQFWKHEDGAAAVEAALVLPFLILLGYGAVDFSNLLISHHKMQTQLTAATDYLSRAPSPQSFETQARNLAVTGQLSGGQPLLAGWSVQDIQINYRNTDNSGGLYRGDAVITSVKLSTSLNYQGFGLVNAIVPGGAAVLTDSYETRVLRSGA